MELKEDLTRTLNVLFFCHGEGESKFAFGKAGCNPYFSRISCSSLKCEREEKQEMEKCRKAMEKRNMEGAKIYAQNAIRKKNEALNFLRLQSRIDAVATRLDTALKVAPRVACISLRAFFGWNSACAGLRTVPGESSFCRRRNPLSLLLVSRIR